MTDSIHILGFGASLRKGGYSTAVLETAKELVPQNAMLEVFTLDGIPMYNQDLEGEATFPQKVKDFKKKIKEADALLIVTPEYNYSIPGYLKNAMDWASRPGGDNSFFGKPASLMSSSNGRFGGIRAQAHMRQVMLTLEMRQVGKPEVIIITAQDKIKDGKIVDEPTREQMKKQLQALVDMAISLKK